jgi:histidyl-tRNA synthetase
MNNAINAVRGMNDVLPDDAHLWEFLEEVVREVFRQYGYRNIRTPIVERTELFVRGVGEVTDIVEKEMYSFVDTMNGEKLSLRPEGTAPTVRATLEHNLLYNGPQRLWYSGPLFRHERPQKGRYRQYHTFGVEALGYAGPDIDVELLTLARRLWQRLGIDSVELQINTIGSAAERLTFRSKLIEYFERHLDVLDEEALVNDAPKLIDEVGDSTRANFEAVQAGLRAAGIAYTLNPRLVRGLDYYNLTVFEWMSGQLGAQSAVCSGGRYDGLFEQLGGKPTPGAGFGIGVERLLIMLEAARAKIAKHDPDVYLVHQGVEADRVAPDAAERLRDAGIAVLMHCGGGSFRSQMKKADASGARYAVIIGDDEINANVITLKPLRSTEEQRKLVLGMAADIIKNGI